MHILPIPLFQDKKSSSIFDDVMKFFIFFDVIFHCKKLIFVKDTTSLLNCKVYAFEKPKQSAIIFYESLQRDF